MFTELEYLHELASQSPLSLSLSMCVCVCVQSVLHRLKATQLKTGDSGASGAFSCFHLSSF